MVTTGTAKGAIAIKIARIIIIRIGIAKPAKSVICFPYFEVILSIT